MDLWSKMLQPFMSIRFPAGGDVYMDYSPWTNWGFSASKAGDPEIEREIFTNVALPGRQLGHLTDAVLALIEVAKMEAPHLDEGDSQRAEAIREFEALAMQIQTRKDELKKGFEGKAEDALRRLKERDPFAYERIIEREYRDLEDAKRRD